MSLRFQVFAENGHVSEHRSRTAAEAAARSGSKKHRIELRVYEGGFSRDPVASFYMGQPFPHASPREAAERSLARVPSVASSRRVLPDCRCESPGSPKSSRVGWVHMDDSSGRGPGIERCDSCARFDSDTAAAAAHARACSCGLTVAY